MAHILIIGGTRGLGNAIAKILNNGENLISLVGRTRHLVTIQNDDNVHLIIKDINKDNNAVKSITKQAYDKYGPINHLILCQRLRDKDNSFDLEIDLAIKFNKSLVDEMNNYWTYDQNNSILFCGSILGKYISNTQDIAYHLSKAAMEQMTRYYAVQLGPKGIRVNNICPYIFIKEETAEYFLQNNKYQALINSTPLRKLQHAKEIAELVEFLCSKKASIITGQNLILDGGYSLTLER